MSKPMQLSRNAVVTVLILAGASIAAPEAIARFDKNKPSLALRAHPAVAFAPARITVTARLRGGDDDARAFYCAEVEWDWDDGTRSEAASDCDPYVEGQSEIRRSYTARHTYRQAGTYRLRLRLKQGKDVIASSSATVSIRPGSGPGSASPEGR